MYAPSISNISVLYPSALDDMVSLAVLVTLLAYSSAFVSRSVIVGRISTCIGSSSQVRSGNISLLIQQSHFASHKYSERSGFSLKKAISPSASLATQYLYLFSIFVVFQQFINSNLRYPLLAVSISLAPWASAVVSATLVDEFASTPLPTVLSAKGLCVVCHTIIILSILPL